MTGSTIDVEVVFALPERQALIEVSLPGGASVADAIEASGVRREFPDLELDACDVGVWGRIVKRNRTLRQGDRVEIYRPLQIDPKEARRQLATMGRTMKDGRD